MCTLRSQGVWAEAALGGHPFACRAPCALVHRARSLAAAHAELVFRARWRGMHHCGAGVELDFLPCADHHRRLIRPGLGAKEHAHLQSTCGCIDFFIWLCPSCGISFRHLRMHVFPFVHFVQLGHRCLTILGTQGGRGRRAELISNDARHVDRGFQCVRNASGVSDKPSRSWAGRLPLRRFYAPRRHPHTCGGFMCVSSGMGASRKFASVAE
mmetsp:Transcript_12270/g.25935  ORF Transcript_12270/g.25935 Transcript_12270/m.25935 type:complete len:212 (+) Transcript_12270:2348-2983(+)